MPQQTFLQQYGLTIVLAILTLAALAAAVTLQILSDDASDAWKAFAGFAVFFGGVHVTAPGTANVPTTTTATTQQ